MLVSPGTTRIESIMGDTTQWKKGRLLGSGGGGKVWYGMTQEKIEVIISYRLEIIAYSYINRSDPMFVVEIFPINRLHTNYRI